MHFSQGIRVPVSPHPRQPRGLCSFIAATLSNVRWGPIVVLIVISLRIRDVVNLFMLLLAIRIFSLGKCLFSFCPFLIGLFVPFCH